jgi:hypothetical protein
MIYVTNITASSANPVEHLRPRRSDKAMKGRALFPHPKWQPIQQNLIYQIAGDDDGLV